MTLTITQNISMLTVTATSNETAVLLNPVVNTVSSSGSDTITIDGFAVDTAGKTSTEWEVGDTFNGWDNDRFVRGKILTLPVTLPDDLDDKTKVGLVINTTY